MASNQLVRSIRSIAIAPGLGALVSLAQAAPPILPLEVNVTNTPLPVTVTNQTTAPTVYKRTPIRQHFTLSSANYTVPTGMRLVIETVNGGGSCPGTTEYGAVILGISDGSSSFLEQFPTAPVNRQVAFNVVQGSATVRMVMNPGNRLSAFVACDQTETPSVWSVTVWGYLLSVDSPSLSP